MKSNMQRLINIHKSYRLRQLLCGLILSILMLRHPLVAQDTIQLQQIRAVSWANHEDKIAIAFQDGQIQVIDLSGETAPLLMHRDTSLILSLAWSPDDQFIASGSTWPDDTLRIWDARTGTQTFEYSGFGDDILTVAWSPDGNQVIAVTAEGLTDEGNAIIVNPHTHDFSLQSFGVVTDLQWSPDNTKVVFASIGGISVRDATDLSLLFNASIDSSIPRHGLQHQLVTIAWSPNGRYLAGGLGDGQVYIWELNNPQPITTFWGHEYEGEDRFLGWIHALDFDENGTVLTSVSGDGTLRNWNFLDGTLIAEKQVNLNYTAAFSPYGGRVALGLATEASGRALLAPESTGQIVQVLGKDAVEIIVPDTSIEHLNSIAQGCISAEGQRGLTLASDTTQLPAFVEHLATLTDAEIPPGCRADLLAIAGAILAE